MKTTDEIIKENIGLSLESGPLTPMDKGECQYCMNKYLEEYKSAMCEANSNAMLADVRAELEKVKGRPLSDYEMGYRDALEKVSEHFI